MTRKRIQRKWRRRRNDGEAEYGEEIGAKRNVKRKQKDGERPKDWEKERGKAGMEKTRKPED
jgi:hypothetical protein